LSRLKQGQPIRSNVKKKSDDVQDLSGLMVNIQEQLGFLEKKIDALIAQSQEKTIREQHQPKPFQPKPFQRFDQPRHQGSQRPDNNFNRERTLHKAICADCSKECEVPFKPSQDRPVYCKDCFSKRKGASPFKGNSPARPWERGPDRAGHADRPHDGIAKKKFFKKSKRPAVKRRKARG